MPAYENPYGVAVYSACFWPYTFKHGGWKFFIKFCERHGLPWPIGKYPPGTPKAQQEELVDALAAIVQDGCAAIPNDASVELVATGTGMAALPQERLINLCNREMSKALTSQTLATEIQDTGARAASETHRGREMAVNQCDRAIIEDSFNELLAWVTELNIAGAVPPRFEFYQESEARETWASVLDTARGYLDIPVQFAHERLQIPLPAEGEETLPRAVAPVPGVGPEPAAFAAACCPRCGGHRFAADDPPDPASIDAALATLTDEELQGQMDKIIEPVLAFIKKNGVTSETLGRLAEVYPDMDDEALQELLGRMLFVAEVWGRIEAGGGTP
jgi:phage gp29-like protein